ncbi:MAG: hypothetical protein JO119_13485 [Acidobacteria bacterium]|nr:hypothetical protein [Acidobacteriota bacterium]
MRHQFGPGCSAAKPAAASSQRRQAQNNDSAKVNRMVNFATRYIKVIEAKAAQAVQTAATPKQRALSRAFAGQSKIPIFSTEV